MSLCKKCGETDQALFYESIKTYCKEHWKEKVRDNRVANIEYYRSFDKMRAAMPHRVSARESYQKTAEGKAAHAKANKRWAEKYPERRSASHAVNNAVRDGLIEKLPCLICGDENTEAHHPDYSSPLDVVWLCPAHHKQAHAISRKAA